MARKRNFTRAEQKRRIVHRLADWVQKERGEVWATSYRIARGLDMAASDYLRKLLQEMCADGLLIKRVVKKSGRWEAIEYALKPGTYTPPPPRTINFRANGKQQGQLSLW